MVSSPVKLGTVATEASTGVWGAVDKKVQQQKQDKMQARIPSAARHARARPPAVSGPTCRNTVPRTYYGRRRPLVEVCSTSTESSVLTADRTAAVSEQDTAVASTSSAPTAPAPVYKTVKQLRLRSAAAYLPHPDKESYGGEDAHFVSNVSGGAIGVADGVGGWAESGVNPAEYSRMLMRVACAYIEGADVRAVSSLDSWQSTPCASLNSYDSISFSSIDGGSSSDSSSSGRDPAAAVAVVDPRKALDTAHKFTKLPGSATACVVQLCPEQKSLIAANLGDSGFVVVRQGQIVLRSSPKQHFFDCPLQFGSYPEHVDDTDTADDAEIYQLPVLPGDVIIAGSDGLWDNVYSSEILGLVPSKPTDLDQAADRIAKLARRHAADPEFASPYTNEAKSQGYDWPWWMKLQNTRIKDGKVQLGELTGGKMDDITVLIAMVEEAELSVLDVAATEAAEAAAAAAAEAAAAAAEAADAAAAAAAAAAPKVSSSSGGTYSLMDNSNGNGSGNGNGTGSSNGVKA